MDVEGCKKLANSFGNLTLREIGGMTKLLMSGAPTREEAAEIWTAAQTAVFASVYELVSIMPPAHREHVLCETSILLRDNGIAVLKKYAVHEEEEARAELNKQHAGAAS